MAGRLAIASVSRHRSDGSLDSLDFKEGVNVLVGEGNTGKTKWLETIDYLLGDEVSAEDRQDPENVLFSLFESASAVLAVNGEEISVGRKWKEPGSLSKVYVNGEAQNVNDYCRFLMDRLGIPLLHYPQGNPYGSRKWPELTWRTLFRHMYRRETMWSDLADVQPEVDQHASLILFLGAAGRVFSQDYGDLVSKNKRLWELQSRRDQFMSMLDQVSKDLVGADELGVALTPESIACAQERLTQETATIETRRADLLRDIRVSTEKHLIEQRVDIPDIEELSQKLVALQSEQEQVAGAISHVEMRVVELTTVRQLLEDEVWECPVDRRK